MTLQVGRDDSFAATEIVSIVRVGSYVRMIPSAIAAGLRGCARSDVARVLAVRPPFRIKVLRDGLKTPDWYWAGFWRPTRKRFSRRRR